MFGTLFNTLTVAMGAGIGLALRQRVPEELRTVVFSAIGLFTLYIGVDLMADIHTPGGRVCRPRLSGLLLWDNAVGR